MADPLFRSTSLSMARSVATAFPPARPSVQKGPGFAGAASVLPYAPLPKTPVSGPPQAPVKRHKLANIVSTVQSLMLIAGGIFYLMGTLAGYRLGPAKSKNLIKSLFEVRHAAFSAEKISPSFKKLMTRLLRHAPNFEHKFYKHCYD